MISSPPALDEMATVSSLKLSSGGWNEELVRASFSADEAALILPFKILASRGIMVDNRCPICKGRQETTLHALWCCPMLRPIRAMCQFMKGFKVRDEMLFVDFMAVCRDRLILEDFELLCLILWKIWYCRNGRIHNSILILDDDLVPWAMDYLADFKNANSSVKNVSPVGSPSSMLWSPPAIGQLKMNTDAALDAESGRVGVGITIRNHLGEVMASSAQSVEAGHSPQVAEALAIFRGLIFARDSWLLPCSVESDAQVIVNLINSDDTPLSEVGLIVNDINRFLGSNQGCSISFVPRTANRAAHGLAKFSLSANFDNFWMEEVLPCVAPHVHEDCLVLM
ncbi:hypothetical protein Dsin_028452 [Dipteronia sinensis]|uniref:RNase H type-1 domain-containing protein n=1 Tax=Dipteronia sinensis TaxID=43782 RepID=A0AAE0DUJ3_9ROSI|nr:hypothetical protein Dsin_028452 [Dipteronia sinensis]